MGWASYATESRDRSVSKYQFRAPQEWFAEAYATYYEPGMKSGGNKGGMGDGSGGASAASGEGAGGAKGNSTMSAGAACGVPNRTGRSSGGGVCASAA